VTHVRQVKLSADLPTGRPSRSDEGSWRDLHAWLLSISGVATRPRCWRRSHSDDQVDAATEPEAGVSISSSDPGRIGKDWQFSQWGTFARTW
jgi:hypothetical protein